MIHHLIQVLWKICFTAAKHHNIFSYIINRNQTSKFDKVLIQLPEKYSQQHTQPDTELNKVQNICSSCFASI